MLDDNPMARAIVVGFFIVNLVCWVFVSVWAGYINEYVWVRPGEGVSPPPPNWLPISASAFEVLNLYLACACAASGLIAGCWLCVRRNVFPALLILPGGILSGAALAVLSVVSTF